MLWNEISSVKVTLTRQFDLLEHIDRDMMDKKPFDHVLSSTDTPMCIGSRTAARSPMAASIAMHPHNRCVSLQELRVYEGDLEKIHYRFRIFLAFTTSDNHPTQTASNKFVLRLRAAEKKIERTLPVGGDTGESLAADGVTICCGCADATVPFVCVPFVCEDC